MVLRVKPTPTRLPTNNHYIPIDNTFILYQMFAAREAIPVVDEKV